MSSGDSFHLCYSYAVLQVTAVNFCIGHNLHVLMKALAKKTLLIFPPKKFCTLSKLRLPYIVWDFVGTPNLKHLATAKSRSKSVSLLLWFLTSGYVVNQIFFKLILGFVHACSVFYFCPAPASFLICLLNLIRLTTPCTSSNLKICV